MPQTLYQALKASAAMAPDNPFICVPAGPSYAPAGLEWTYREVEQRVEAQAKRYRAAGYGVGHRVALLLDNRPDHFVHLLALNAVGASAVPVNPDYRHSELTGVDVACAGVRALCPAVPQPRRAQRRSVAHLDASRARHSAGGDRPRRRDPRPALRRDRAAVRRRGGVRDADGKLVVVGKRSTRSPPNNGSPPTATPASPPARATRRTPATVCAASATCRKANRCRSCSTAPRSPKTARAPQSW